MEVQGFYFDLYQIIIAFIIGLALLWYIYFTWNFNYWKKQGVLGEKPRLFVGTVKPQWKYDFTEQDTDGMKKFGHVHGGFVSRLPVLFVSDPDLLKQILVKDFQAFPHRRAIGNMDKDELFGNMLSIMKGDKWKMVRNTLTPTYTSGKLKQMVSLIEDCVKHLMKSLKTQAENEEPIDFTIKFPILTLDIIATCAFGMKIDYASNTESEFHKNAKKTFGANPKLVFLMSLFPFLFKCLSKTAPNPFDYFINIAKQAIDMRLQKNSNAKNDFLQIMLEAQIPDDEFDKNETKGSKKTLTREVVIAQTVLFLLAGNETSATTLTFLAYELAQNQDIQDRVIKEIDDLMAKSEGKLTYDGVSSMQYLDMVISETLRLYPPGIRLDRECNEDEYDLNGIVLKKGMSITVPVFAIHRNAEFYPNPTVFDPERFSPENKAKRNPFTYLPFGAGPRNCIAKRFAMMEVKLAISHILSNYRFQTCSETEYPIKTKKGSLLLQPISVKLLLQKRTDQPQFD